MEGDESLGQAGKPAGGAVLVSGEYLQSVRSGRVGKNGGCRLEVFHRAAAPPPQIRAQEGGEGHEEATYQPEQEVRPLLFRVLSSDCSYGQSGILKS